MHQLLLLRHAKSSRKDRSLEDFDRALAGRGRKDCGRMGQWLLEQNLVPDLMISSPAVRARETSIRLCRKIPYDAERIQWEDAIYDANLSTLMGLLAAAPEDAHAVMLVGHFEALSAMILRLGDWSDIPANPKIIPTGAIARFEIDGPWSDIGKCHSRLLSITAPRELRAVRLLNARSSRPV